MIFQIKPGAGEGIRTLDRNLGNGPERPTLQYPGPCPEKLIFCLHFAGAVKM
jgi:hypothetical protein